MQPEIFQVFPCTEIVKVSFLIKSKVILIFVLLYDKSKIEFAKRRKFMKAIVTLSSKNQIAIPRAARKKLAIGPGDQLILDIDKDNLILKPKPKSYTKHLRGLHKTVWSGLNATDYVRKEREIWEDQ
jgi:AbrB family looped-hinge helix DNA binding protein